MFLLAALILGLSSHAPTAVETPQLARHAAEASEDCLKATDKNGVSATGLVAAGWQLSDEGEVDHLPQASFSRPDRTFHIRISAFKFDEPSQCWFAITLERQADYPSFQNALADRLGRKPDNVENRLISDGKPETIPEYFWYQPRASVELSMMPAMKNGPDTDTLFVSVIPNLESAK